ncbi:MAG: SGNH/GDSL hydrolase family protein [Clostridia bacterium]|nr:SGNH/GDSL hydrolase family protein [Clostridia bacterium]
MKKLLSILMIFCIVLGLCACEKGGTASSAVSEVSSDTSSAVTEFFPAPELEALPAIWDTQPTIKWSELKGGATARVVVEDESGNVIVDKSGLTGTEYTLETPLIKGKYYTLKVFYTRNGQESSMVGITKRGRQMLCLAKKTATLKDIAKKIENSKDYLITFVGDSVTLGIGNTGDEKSYPAFFARRLAEKFPDRKIVRYDGIINGERVPLKEYSAPITVRAGEGGKITVVRSGVGSSQVTDTINRMDTDFMGTANGRLPKKADLLVIHLGINDQGYGASPMEFKERLLKLGVQILRDQPETDVIFMTPTSSVANSKAPASENPLNGHSEAMKEAAEELGFPVIDMHAVWMEHYVQGGANFGMRNWHYDRWHPSDKGYEVMGDKIFENLFG